MAFQPARRTRIVMLMVSTCPKSGFLDVPHGRGPPADPKNRLLLVPVWLGTLERLTDTMPDQVKAGMPVMARPMIRMCTSSVPS
jgi:hypothetical protein